MYFFLFLQILPNIFCQDFPLDVNIENGIARCTGVDDCLVDCDYGFISNGTYIMSLESLESTTSVHKAVDLQVSLDAACVFPVGVIIGGYNQDWNHDDVYLSSTELYSMTGLQDCHYDLPDLPVVRKGMFGGWAGNMATVCGGEDSEAVVHQDCFTYNFEDNVWLYDEVSVRLEVERSYAAAALVDSCLVVSGGLTSEGVTDSMVGLHGNCLAQYPRLPRPREGHCMVQVGDELVVIGGGPDSYGSTQVLDLSSGQWREGAPPQKDRALHDCSAVMTEQGEAVLVAGNDFSPMDLAEIYYPATDTWQWTPGWMNNERTGAAMTILGGRPTVISGYGGDYCCKEYYTTAETYDAQSGHWWLLHARYYMVHSHLSVLSRRYRNLTEGRKGHAVIPLPSDRFPGCV